MRRKVGEVTEIDRFLQFLKRRYRTGDRVILGERIAVPMGVKKNTAARVMNSLIHAGFFVREQVGVARAKKGFNSLTARDLHQAVLRIDRERREAPRKQEHEFFLRQQAAGLFN